jgi:hypothetical protein
MAILPEHVAPFGGGRRELGLSPANCWSRFSQILRARRSVTGGIPTKRAKINRMEAVSQKTRGSILWALIVIAWTTTPTGAQSPAMPTSRIASIVIDQFKEFDLLGLGEQHGSLADADLRVAVVRQKEFPARAGNVVVEGLNSLYQEDIDRYIQGDDVPKEHLQRAWRDTTQVFANPVMLTASEQFLSEIRSINLHLPPRLRIHVIAADPPINWAMIQSREQFLPFLRNRVDFAAEVIEREILQKQKKALLVFGLGHLMRNQQIKTTEGFIPLSPTLVGLLDSNSPGRLWVVVPCRSSTGPNSATLTARIHNAKFPALIRLKGTPSGSLDPNEYLLPHSSLLLGAPPPPFHMFRDGLEMAAVADACIYRGSATDGLVIPASAYGADKSYDKEVDRRRQIAAPPH